MSERFIRPTPRVDNIGQPIAASDINTLQEIGLWTQAAAFRQSDEQFQQQVLLALMNNPLVNRGWVDLFADTAYIDATNTQLQWDVDERALVLPGTTLSGVYQSKQMHPEGIRQIRFLLGMTTAHLPTGCTVTWQVRTNGADWYPLPETGDPLPLARYGQTLQVRATLTRPTTDLRPQLRGVAVLFEDYNTGRVSIDERLYIVPPTNYDGPRPGIDGPGTGGTTEPGQGELDGIFDPDRPIISLSHWELSDVLPDQHHPKNHRHNHDGIDPVHLDEDTVGLLPVNQLPSEAVLESEFLTLLPQDLVYLNQLTTAINNLHQQITQEFPTNLTINLPNTQPEDFPCFVPVRVMGDTRLTRDPVTGRLVQVDAPREVAALVYGPTGPLSHVVIYACDEASVDVLVRVGGALQRIHTAALLSPPGPDALVEAQVLANSLASGG